MKLHSRFLAAAILLVLLAAPAHAGTEWDKLHAGMSRAEVLKLLGEPLFRNKARGFERWIYDGSGEVLFSGGPIHSWTCATPNRAALAKSMDSDVLIRPYRPTQIVSDRVLYPEVMVPNSTYEREAASGFRRS